MMACSEYRERLLDHAMGASPAADLAAHLKSCPVCATELERRKVRGAEFDAALGRLVNPEPPPYMPARIAADIEAQASAAPGWRPRVAIVAVLLAVVAVGAWLVSARQERQAAAAAAAISRWRSPTASLLHPPSQPVYKESFHEPFHK